MKKKVILSVLGAVLLASASKFAYASEVSGQKVTREIFPEEKQIVEEYGYKIKEIYESDEDFRESIKNGGKIVGIDDIYVKFTPKQEEEIRLRTTESKYETEVFDYEGYVREEKKRATIGDFVPDGGSNIWLNLFMSAVDYGDNLFSASSYFNWKNIPTFTFTDGHGISVDPTFTIIAGAPGNYSNYERESGKGRSYTNTTGTMQIKNGGSVSNVPLEMMTNGAMTSKHYGKHQVVFESNNTTNRSGNIYNTYLHKQVGIGGIGIASDGKPNLTISGSHDTFGGALTIRNMN